MNSNLSENIEDNNIQYNIMTDNIENCTICLNELNINNSTLNCNHKFCTDCINNLLINKKYICPLCRIPISKIIDNENNTTKLIITSQTNHTNHINHTNDTNKNCIFICICLLINFGMFTINVTDNNSCYNKLLDDCLNDCLSNITNISNISNINACLSNIYCFNECLSIF